MRIFNYLLKSEIKIKKKLYYIKLVINEVCYIINLIMIYLLKIE